MTQWSLVAYRYDGSFSGFLTCVYESYVHREAPACFLAPEDVRFSLWPERDVEPCPAYAKKVYASLASRISKQGQQMAAKAFLTCLPDREMHIWRFIQYGYQQGASVTQDLTDERVAVLYQALQHLKGEVHLYRGFVRFSEQDGLLLAEIAPKNRVLPLIRPHFCSRYNGESFLIYDRTHHEALFYRPGQWRILPLETFQPAAPGKEELDYRRLWKRFYDTIAIEERYNPKCRMTHMPKRYWDLMTEFQAPAPSSTASGIREPSLTDPGSAHPIPLQEKAVAKGPSAALQDPPPPPQ